MAWNSTKPFTGFSIPKGKDVDVDMESKSSPAQDKTSENETSAITIGNILSGRPEGFQEAFETGIEYQKFARPLEKLQRLRTGGSKSEFDMTSILPEFEALCATRAQQFEYRKDSDADYLAFGAKDEYKLWQAESHTWVLLTTLLGAFENQRPYIGKGAEPLEWSDMDLVEHLANTDSNFKHHAAVKVWLETIAPRFTPIAVAKTRTPESSSTATTLGRPTFSFNPPQPTSAASAAATGTSGSKKTEYQDPDATTRDGIKLSDRNQRAEQDLLKTVWEYLRRGKIEEAKKACIKADEHWRAESIGGGDLYTVPVAFTDPVYDLEDDRHGNKTRSLWKGTCFALANEKTADQYERAVYGALCGDVPSVLPVCSSWEDHAWVHYNALVESMIEARLSQFNRGGASKALPLPMPKVASATDIFAALTNSDSQDLRNASQETFRAIQTSVILGTTGELVVKMAKDAKAAARAGQAALQPHLLRFMTHFVLLLRTKTGDFPKKAGDYFIKSYVDYLISRKMYDLAPLYASHLPIELQVEACSSYLKNVDGSKKDRQEHLHVIRRNGLDLHRILTSTVDGLLEKNKVDFEQSSISSSRFSGSGYLINLNKSIMTTTTSQEKASIKALEWLSFDPAHSTECLFRSNFLARKYLVQGRMNAAFALFNSLPADLDQLEQLDNEAETSASVSNAQEHMHYKDLFTARLLFEEWKDFMSTRPSENTAQGSKMMAWELDLKERAQKTITEIEALLSSRWLFDCVLPGDDVRNQELRRLRQIYISELVMNLHEVYYESRGVVPDYLEKSVEMSNLVASEGAGVPIYKELQESERLIEFLDQLRMSSVELVRERKSPFAF